MMTIFCKMDVKETLQRLGYSNLKEYGKEYRTKPLYRDSDNQGNVLSIYKDTGYFIDHARSDIRGSLAELVKITLNLKTIQEARKWLGRDYETLEGENESIFKKSYHQGSVHFINQNKIFHENNLNHLIPNHEYWKNRGISESTMDMFKGGVDDGVEGGKFYGRYVFPIFNVHKEILGFSGRNLLKNESSSRAKWKHLGPVSKALYPSFLNEKFITKERQIILVESIGDMLSLWDGGIKNTLVLFGVNLTDDILYYLLKIKPKKIIISLNDDGESSKAGNRATQKIYNDLNSYFDEDLIQISLPTKNDFNEMSAQEIKRWANSL